MLWVGWAVGTETHLQATRCRSAEVHTLAVRTLGLYTMFHIGGFLYWSLHGDAHPPGYNAWYVASLLVAAAALWAWGRGPRAAAASGGQKEA